LQRWWLTLLLSLSLFIPMFCVLPVSLRDCLYREKIWVGGYVTVIFYILSIENTDFRQTRTCKKMTGKSLKHLLRRASDSQFFLVDNFHLTNKSTWQVSCHVDLLPSPLASLQITWQVITWQVDLSSQLVKSSYQHKCRTRTYSQLQIGWHRILRLFLKTFNLVPGIPGFLLNSSLSFISWY